ncbi:hypothetical protein AVEN_198672-1 [Araneus ventricosus]|uniref:Uncharacterized protein n=1 Tax=Araneus ventricosus TaxID=182803 RepID=A0A4Y1ZN50_ARAVE|nr:hypothetical protein AVEN_198672-1 [Araneus ventricosus]
MRVHFSGIKSHDHGHNQGVNVITQVVFNFNLNNSHRLAYLRKRKFLRLDIHDHCMPHKSDHSKPKPSVNVEIRHYWHGVEWLVRSCSVLQLNILLLAYIEITCKIDCREIK